MNGDQRSVTAAFLLVFAGLAVRHHWPSRLATWAGKPPAVKTVPPTSNVVPIGALNDWQAAIIAYGLLFLLADTQAAPVTSPLAWAVGLVALFGAVGQLSEEYPGLFGGKDVLGPQGTSNVAQGRQNVPQGSGAQAKTVAG